MALYFECQKKEKNDNNIIVMIKVSLEVLNVYIKKNKNKKIQS